MYFLPIYDYSIYIDLSRCLFTLLSAVVILKDQFLLSTQERRPVTAATAATATLLLVFRGGATPLNLRHPSRSVGRICLDVPLRTVF